MFFAVCPKVHVSTDLKHIIIYIPLDFTEDKHCFVVCPGVHVSTDLNRHTHNAFIEMLL